MLSRDYTKAIEANNEEAKILELALIGIMISDKLWDKYGLSKQEVTLAFDKFGLE